MVGGDPELEKRFFWGTLKGNFFDNPKMGDGIGSGKYIHKKSDRWTE